MNPTVSIIIPTYNRADQITRTINSVLSQTFTNYEIIVVDDFSSDNTEEIISSFPDEVPIVYKKHEKNLGGSAARNTGIKIAKGEIIAFLDSDDSWAENKLEKMVGLLLASGNDYGVCFSSYYVITPEGETLNQKETLEGYIFDKEIYKDYVSPTSAVVVKKECFESKGYFDESLPARQDYDMWIRLSEKYKFIYINEPLVKIYRVKEERISSNYMNQVNGTLIVMDKITRNYEGKLNNKIIKEVTQSQYSHIIKILINNGDQKNSRKFIKKIINDNPLNYKGYLFFILSLLNQNHIMQIKNIIRMRKISKSI